MYVIMSLKLNPFLTNIILGMQSAGFEMEAQMLSRILRKHLCEIISLTVLHQSFISIAVLFTLA